MADKLVFPIGFDLEAGLKQAQDDINRTVRALDNAIKNKSVKLSVGFDAAMAKRLREEAKDIDRVLAYIKNNYGKGQLKGLSIGFINTEKEVAQIKNLHAQLQSMREQRTSLVNAGATEQELNRIDSAIKKTEQQLKELNHAFNRDHSFNIAISQQIVRLKQLSEELAGIDRMYARLQASAGAANQSANSFAANEMLARRKEIMEEIARVTRTATEAQKELFNISGVGIGASQSTSGYGGEQGLSAITAQIERYEQLKKELQDIEGQYERLKAMQAQGMGDQSEKINQTLQRRIAIQKELGDITQTAAQAQKALEENAKKSAVAFQRGRSAMDNFNRTMKLPENRIMNIQAKINALNQALKRVSVGSTEFNKIVAELNRLGQKLDEAKAKQQALSSEQEKGIKKATSAFREQKSYLNILIQRLAVYSSMGAVMGFLTKVREVTAQFELQRVSLGAIINDQVRANALFNEIKQFALQSPIKILDLTKYTKQMAAFRFETDTLFESTKRMADISVGLSVPMDRLILALGHVKAATHLTGITLRQFSMAGIPMLELLAEKYSELEGRAVSVADVQKRVHDKMVSFDDVNQVFTDLTSKGGMFYNMQIKQGNTLYGLWAKLGDAASVMYEQIGNTPFVNEGMKDAINMLTTMMRNWRDVARVATEAGIAFGIYKLAVTASTKATALATVWNKKDILLRQMHLKTVMAQSWSVRNFNKVLLASGVSAQKASTATWIFSRALNGLRAAIATTGIGLLVVGIGLLIDRLIFGKSAADELGESLDRIKLESSQEQDKSVANFERLANVATSSTSSYKQQQEALEELRRTYKGMISEEMLTIENLKSLNGHYEQLTASVRAYINEQMKQKQIDEITNTYAYDILKLQRQVRDGLKHKYSDEQIFEFWDRYAQNVKDKTKSAGKSVSELINLTVSEMGASMQFAHDLGAFWKASGYDYGFVVLPQITYLIKDQERQIDALGKVYDSTAMAMGKFADSYNEAVNSIKENGVSLNGNILNEKDNPLLFSQQEANLEVKDAMVPTIKEAFKEAGMAFDEGWVSLIDNIDENAPHLTSSINFEPMIEKAKSESKRLQDELQKQLELLIAQREAYMKQIQVEEGKGKGKNDEAIANMKAQYNSLGESIAELEEKAKSVNAVLPLLDSLRKKFENIAPSDPVVKIMRKRFDQIVDYTKSYAKNMRRFRMDADESMEAYRKRLTDEVDLIKKNIKAWTAAMVLARLFRNKTEEQNLQNLISEAKLQLADLEKILGDMPEFEKSKSRKSDDRLSKLQEILSTLEKINTKYEELRKKEGDTKALEDIQKMYANTLEYANKLGMQFGLKFEMPTNFKDLQKARESVLAVIRKLRMKGYEKAALDLEEKIGTGDIDKLQKNIEAQIKELADRISRTKTAKEFYEKILSQTGDVELAKSVSLSIYGDDGAKLFEQTVEQIKEVFKSGNADVVIDVDAAIDTANQRINYKMLADIYDKYQNDIIEKNRDTAQKLISEGQKTAASNVSTWEKELAKAKDYEQQRTDVIRRETQRRAEIYKSNLPQQEKDRLVEQSRNKQDKEIADLNWKEFKESDDYIKIFENLDNVSTAALKRLRANLEGVKTANADLSPENMKALVKAMADIDEQISGRGFGNVMVQSAKDYIQAMRDLKTAKTELKAAEAEYETQEPMLDANIDAAKQEEIAAQTALNLLKQDELATENQIVAAELRLNTATSNVAEAENKKAQAVDKVKKAEQKVTYQQDKQKKATSKFFKDMQQVAQTADQLASELSDVKDLLGISEDSAAGLVFDSAVSGLQAVSKAIAVVTAAQAIYNAVCMSNPYIAAAAGVLAVFSAIGSFLTSNKVRKANKEIKRQQELLDQLEYAYGRLEKAADKAFGRDYINNFKAQQKNLEAQAAAYQKQADAERSKGKKADKDKIKEYENAYRETMDEIADMQGQVAAQMLGTDLTSAARDFAKAWLEAYKEFGSTADAMSEKFREMVENMVVESLLAKVMERALKPMFDMIDNMDDTDFYSETFWKNVVDTAEQGAKDADAGAQAVMKFLGQAGLSMRDLGGEMTGISREIATASEESVNGLATEMHTFNFYGSHLPTISENVAAMRSLMEVGDFGSRTAGEAGIDRETWQREAFDRFAAMERHMAECVTECRRSAAACEEQVAQLRRVIVPKGTSGAYGVQVYMRN